MRNERRTITRAGNRTAAALLLLPAVLLVAVAMLPRAGWAVMIKTITLEHASPERVIPVIVPMLSPSGKVILIPGTRDLWIDDKPDVLALVEQKIGILDQPRVTHMFELNQITAEAAEKALEGVISPETGDVQAIPESGILLVTDLEQNIRKAVALMATIDGEPQPAHEEPTALDTVIAGGIQVNNEDIRDVLAILANYTGIHMITDKAVVGRVSFQFANDVNVRTVLDQVLPSYGWCYELDEKTNTVRIDLEGKCEVWCGGDDIGKTFALKHLGPDRVLPHIESMLSPVGKATVVPGTREIHVQDIPEVVARIEQKLDVLDGDRVTHVVRPQYLDLDTVQRALEGVISAETADVLARPELGVLVLTDTAENVHRALVVIDAVDVESQVRHDNPVRDRIYSLSYLEAEKAVAALRRLSDVVDVKATPLPEAKAIALQGDVTAVYTAITLLDDMDKDTPVAYRHPLEPEQIEAAMNLVRPLLSEDCALGKTDNPAALYIHDKRSRVALACEALAALEKEQNAPERTAQNREAR